MTLRGSVAVVTGAGRGIGREITVALAGQGVQLAALARTGHELQSLAGDLHAAHGARVLPFAVDVRDAAAVRRVVAHVEQQLGPVDLLVNNAGVIEPVEQPFWEVDVEQSWSVVEVNLRGPMVLCAAVLPAMVQRGHGRVVNLTSRARAATATGTYTGYAVSKRALSAFTQALAVPLAGTGVVVVDLLPGLVRTPMTGSMPVWRGVPEHRWTPVAATAQVVLDVASGRYDDRSGTVLDAVELWAARPGPGGG